MADKKMWRFVLQAQNVEDAADIRKSGVVLQTEMPKNAVLLGDAIEMTSKGLVVLALVDADDVLTEERRLADGVETETREFFACDNGVEIPDEAGHVLAYRGRCKPGPGSPTVHVFELAV